MIRVNKSPLAGHKDKELRQQLLLSDYDLLKKFITTHLFIHIKEAFGFPPEKYHLVYRVDGLLQAGKSVEPKNAHIVEIVLPDNYPDAPPVCSMLSAIFHPNISGDRIDIKEQWSAKATLIDAVAVIGKMIAFQKYSTASPLNKEAAQWAIQNKNLLPLSAVDFNRQADAAPSGPRTKAAVPAGAGRAADVKDTGGADTIIFEDAAAHLIAGREPRDDDTAQLPVEKKAPSITAAPALPQSRKKVPQAPALEK